MSAKKVISIFFPFRSFHNQEFNSKVIFFFLFPPIFNLITLFFIDNITQGWGTVLEYLLPTLDAGGTVLYTEYFLFSFRFFLPSINLPADMPDAMTWWVVLFLSIIVFFISFFIRERFTPLVFLLRAFVFVIWCSLLFFLVYPGLFPYDIALYTKTGFLQILSMMFAIPWIYCFTYYMFGYRIIKKLLVTSAVLIYFAVLAPFQYLTNAYLIYMSSLLLMPALYVYAGLLINIFSAVAFFAYGVSLEQIYTKFSKIKENR